MQAAFLEPDFLLVGEVGGNRRVGNRQVLDVYLAEDLVDLAEHPLAADRAEAEADVEQAQHVEVIQAFHPLAVLAQLAGGVDATDHRAHGTTGDAGDLIAACLEFLDHADVRVAARTAGAQYQGDLFAHLQPLANTA